MEPKGEGILILVYFRPMEYKLSCFGSLAFNLNLFYDTDVGCRVRNKKKIARKFERIGIKNLTRTKTDKAALAVNNFYFSNICPLFTITRP